jgi:tRNA-dihydrouridine synthase
MYRSEVRYDFIARAAAELPCPVLANGNVYSAAKADEVLRSTGVKGLMIGRGAIRNPWIFEQFRQYRRGETVQLPRGRDVLAYVQGLYEIPAGSGLSERSQVQRMKKFMNYLGVGVDPEGRFLHEVRRATSRAGFFGLCREFLDHDQPMPLEPFRLSLGERDVMAGELR